MCDLLHLQHTKKELEEIIVSGELSFSERATIRDIISLLDSIEVTIEQGSDWDDVEEWAR